MEWKIRYFSVKSYFLWEDIILLGFSLYKKFEIEKKNVLPIKFFNNWVTCEIRQAYSYATFIISEEIKYKFEGAPLILNCIYGMLNN